MKLLIALALAGAPSALAMAPYVPSELNGCGEPCVGFGTIVPQEGLCPDPGSLCAAVESDICYEVAGSTPGLVFVPETVKCAKITVPRSSGVNTIRAHLLRPSFAPRRTKS